MIHILKEMGEKRTLAIGFTLKLAFTFSDFTKVELRWKRLLPESWKRKQEFPLCPLSTSGEKNQEKCLTVQS